MLPSLRANVVAMNTARHLKNSCLHLSASVQRLSSGLRLNAAADDVAGLGIRELMRADIATFKQGVRNANDAISMIQVAEGALQVIDEKLIRMKELAEQAATGKLKIHFGAANRSAEDYYYINIGDATLEGLGLRSDTAVASGGMGEVVEPILELFLFSVNG